MQSGQHAKFEMRRDACIFVCAISAIRADDSVSMLYVMLCWYEWIRYNENELETRVRFVNTSQKRMSHNGRKREEKRKKKKRKRKKRNSLLSRVVINIRQPN